MTGARIDWNRLADYLVTRGVSSTLCSMARLDGFMIMCTNGEINLEEVDGRSLGVLIAGETVAGELEAIADKMKTR